MINKPPIKTCPFSQIIKCENCNIYSEKYNKCGLLLFGEFFQNNFYYQSNSSEFISPSINTFPSCSYKVKIYS